MVIKDEYYKLLRNQEATLTRKVKDGLIDRVIKEPKKDRRTLAKHLLFQLKEKVTSGQNLNENDIKLLKIINLFDFSDTESEKHNQDMVFNFNVVSRDQYQDKIKNERDSEDDE